VQSSTPNKNAHPPYSELFPEKTVNNIHRMVSNYSVLAMTNIRHKGSLFTRHNFYILWNSAGWNRLVALSGLGYIIWSWVSSILYTLLAKWTRHPCVNWGVCITVTNERYWFISAIFQHLCSVIITGYYTRARADYQRGSLNVLSVDVKRALALHKRSISTLHKVLFNSFGFLIRTSSSP